MTIPVQRPFLGAEELRAVERVFESRWLGLGACTQEFERALCAFLGVAHVVAVNTGTAALHIALDLLDLKPEDEVLVPTLTFAATTQAVVMAGATPVFCDVDARTFNLDVHDAAARITARTKAILPVHYGGTACDMDAVRALAAQAGLKVIEDAAHAFGSTYRGHKIGTLSDLTCFSFDPIKNITCGEGGAVATNDRDMAERAAARRVLGITKDTWSRQGTVRPWSYDVAGPGFRYHMSNINAAIGLEQLKRFDAFRQRRQAIARRYDEALADLPGLVVREQHLPETCPFSYVIRVLDDRRDALMDHLRSSDIMTGVHYIPNHLHRAFAHRRTSLPVAERLGQEILTLPLFYEMTDPQVEFVIAAVRRFFAPRAVAAVASARSAGRRRNPRGRFRRTRDMSNDTCELLILGTRTFAEEVADLASTISGIHLAGFVENMEPQRCHHSLEGLPVHWIDDITSLVDSHRAVFALSTTHRSRYVEQATRMGFKFATLIHPTATLSKRSEVGEGSILCAACVIGAHSVLGPHVIVNRGALIGHHTAIGPYCSIQPGANVAGACSIGAATYVGMGAIILDHLTIGAHAVVGAGAVVTRDVPDYTQVMGVPARVVKENIEGR